jgi:hypothetical protein
MTPITQDSKAPSELADALSQQRRILQDHYDVLRELRARIAEYERQHGFASADVHQAIDDGRLEETHDVCTWLIDIDLLERIEHATG